MRDFNSERLEIFSHLFPELSREEYETGMLYVMGYIEKEIARNFSSNCDSVKRTLNEVKKKFNVTSLDSVYSFFHMRLLVFLLNVILESFLVNKVYIYTEC